jgi:hypothetical protein
MPIKTPKELFVLMLSDLRHGVELSPILRQTVKTQFLLNGDLSHGIVSTEVHEGV